MQIYKHQESAHRNFPEMEQGLCLHQGCRKYLYQVRS